MPVAPTTGVRLYVFPHAGGSGLMYQSLPSRFPSDWRVTALDAPGHGTLMARRPLTDGEALISHYLDRLGPERDGPAVPFAFFGHSMGAVVAFELTRRLLAVGRTPPVWLGLSACGAPPADRPPAPEPYRELSDAELRERVARLGGTPRRVLDHPGMWAHFAQVFRADLRLMETWRPAPLESPLPVPVSLFGGARDTVVGLDRLERWAERCARLLSVHVFPGDHFYFRDAPDSLADAVVLAVTTALGRSSVTA